jgi:predicted SnoaL-like aldol condensation-catalyzing enzyme
VSRPRAKRRQRAAGAPEVSAGKVAATNFLKMSASGRAREAFRQYAAENFVHHNPFFPHTAEALMTAMDDNARQNPEKRLDILRVIEQDDLVAVHSRVHQSPADRGAALVHIFRFQDDRIVELWDIGQPVPDDAKNDKGMF